MRLASKKAATQEWADFPALFMENRQPREGNYLIVPRVSSERRYYVPTGFMTSDTIASDAVQIIPDAALYHLGVPTSSVHLVWMRAS